MENSTTPCVAVELRTLIGKARFIGQVLLYEPDRADRLEAYRLKPLYPLKQEIVCK